MFASLYFLLNIIYKRINRQTELLSTYFDKNNKKITEINEEYDIIIDSIIKGFMSQSYINYKKYNDNNRYNAYLIEYFFYCLSEIKYHITPRKGEYVLLDKEYSFYTKSTLFQMQIR